MEMNVINRQFMSLSNDHQLTVTNWYQLTNWHRFPLIAYAGSTCICVTLMASQLALISTYILFFHLIVHIYVCLGHPVPSLSPSPGFNFSLHWLVCQIPQLQGNHYLYRMTICASSPLARYFYLWICIWLNTLVVQRYCMAWLQKIYQS